MKQKRRLDSWLERHLPIGMWVGRERCLIVALLSGACVWALVWYTLFYTAARRQLYIYVHGRLELAPQARMADFTQIFPGALTGFWLVVVVMILKVLDYYRFHSRDTSRSIYLMRRLSDPWELRRRCWTVPLCTVAVSLLLAAVTTALCYLVYIKCTPADAIMPGQWARFWGAGIGG